MRMNVCDVRILLLNDKVIYPNFFGVLGSNLPDAAHFYDSVCTPGLVVYQHIKEAWLFLGDDFLRLWLAVL